MKYNKFYLECQKCKFQFELSKEIIQNQQCAKCENKHIDVKYVDGLKQLPKAIFGESNFRSLWKYLKYLPLHKVPSTIRYENDISIKQLTYLEKIAEEFFNVKCKVYGHRFDESISTGTWKDLSGAMLGSALKENGIKNYVVASTGNIGVAMACYLTLNGINLYAFIPDSSSKAQEAEIASFGQRVFRVKGDYAKAKQLAKDFARKHEFTYSNGTFDIFRIEAKKTMAFEWARILENFPTVYIQALSGGTGPLGVYKGSKELKTAGLIEQSPRQILVQTAKCAPMATAWNKAKKNSFKGDWQNDYPILDNPDTSIATLSTGNPYGFPVLGRIMKETNGHITSIDEQHAADIARVMASKTSIRIGPAAAIGMGGFYKGLKENQIHDDDIVMINIGEGMRRSPDFLTKLLTNSIQVDNIEDLSNLNLSDDVDDTVSKRIEKLIKEL